MDYITGLGTPYSFLTGMYSRPGRFATGIYQVMSVKEGGVSILSVVLIVCLIFYMIYHKE